jgi:hypothetical protein
MIPIKDFDGYSITDCGKIYSHKTNRFVKSFVGTSGYLATSLRRNGKTVGVAIHRIVAKAYLPINPDKDVVNHKDGNKLNNHVSNLEWCTYSENSIHAQNQGLTPKPPSWIGKKGYDHNRSMEVIEIDASGNEVCKYGSLSEAGRNRGVCVSMIYLAIKNNSVTRQGFRYIKST